MACQKSHLTTSQGQVEVAYSIKVTEPAAYTVKLDHAPSSSCIQKCTDKIPRDKITEIV
jgi:hypothetical protein